MGVTVFYGALIILANLAVDLLYGLLDPAGPVRLRTTMTVTAFPPSVSPAEEIKGRSLWSDARRRLLRNRPPWSASCCCAIIALASRLRRRCSAPSPIDDVSWDSISIAAGFRLAAIVSAPTTTAAICSCARCMAAGSR